MKKFEFEKITTLTVQNHYNVQQLSNVPLRGKIGQLIKGTVS